MGRKHKNATGKPTVVNVFSDLELRVDLSERLLPCGHSAYWLTLHYYSSEKHDWIDIGILLAFMRAVADRQTVDAVSVKVVSSFCMAGHPPLGCSCQPSPVREAFPIPFPLTALITTREDANGTVQRVALAYGATKTECEANARLIASAPAQHCTLTRVVAAIEDMLEDDSLQITGECGDLLLQIASMSKAVIAKAEKK